jgi:hypothetical protein
MSSKQPPRVAESVLAQLRGSLPVSALRGRHVVHSYLWTGNISCDQQPDQDHGSQQAGSNQGEKREV